MSENLQDSINEIDKDLDHSWIDLSAKVRILAADLKLKAAGSSLAHDADHLAQEASMLCDHVERLHADVLDLMVNIESRVPLYEPDGSAVMFDYNDVEKESIQIQRESHELRADFKDVIKALFMWRDDPTERIRGRK